MFPLKVAATLLSGLRTSTIVHSSNIVRAIHLAYIESRWYGSRISADCQENLLSPKHDTSGRFLVVIFLKEQKRWDNTQRDNLLAGKR